MESFAAALLSFFLKPAALIGLGAETLANCLAFSWGTWEVAGPDALISRAAALLAFFRKPAVLVLGGAN